MPVLAFTQSGDGYKTAPAAIKNTTVEPLSETAYDDADSVQERERNLLWFLSFFGLCNTPALNCTGTQGGEQSALASDLWRCYDSQNRYCRSDSCSLASNTGELAGLYYPRC
jgi:hypothetical protein